MANHTSTKKSIRQNAKRTLINKNRKSRVRTFLKKVEEAIAGGDKAKSNEALKAAQSEMMKAVNKGVFKKNTASRKISRLSARIKAAN